jgi:hypothetical protein
MSGDPPKYSIENNLDPNREMSPNAEPLTEYLAYLSDVQKGAVEPMGFTVQDFEAYIAGLRNR